MAYRIWASLIQFFCLKNHCHSSANDLWPGYVMTIQKTCPQKIKIKDVGRLEAREGLAHNFQCNVLTKPPRAVYQSHVS